MNKEEVVKLLTILQTAFPRFYVNQTKEEMIDAVNLWHDMFRDDEPKLVIAAAKELLTTLKYPPTIADIKEKMYKLSEGEINKETPIELWNKITKAISNSIYNSSAEFEKLPEPCKKFVGSPRQLMEWAMSTDFNDSVVRGQFLKQLEIIQQREKELKMMLPENRQLIEDLSSGFKLLN